MRIIAENIYNTQSHRKSLSTLKNLANQHLWEITTKIKEIDPDATVLRLHLYEVDWTEERRGRDIRFKLLIQKKGRKLTARTVYQICNEVCLRPCYFTKPKIQTVNL